MMPLGAPSISKYGSLVRPDAQIVALRAHCALDSYAEWFAHRRLCANCVYNLPDHAQSGDGLGLGHEALYGVRAERIRNSVRNTLEPDSYAVARGVSVAVAHPRDARGLCV